MTRRHDPQLTALAGAGTVAFGPIGIAAHTLPETQAYLDLAAADDPAVRPELERLLATGSPASKVYAAALLARLDPGAGRDAWRRLARDKGEFTTFNGCIGGRATLAEYATTQLDAA